ncbi:MAG: glycolate oxidase subunit GlcF [Pseudomonadales bacterium]
MKTTLHPRFRNSSEAARAETIMRSCVHCGFCTSGCPTYQLLGDENDSPRGRIALIKEMFEVGEVNEAHSTHLDRCLTCRSCETHCPSGVAYTELLDIAKGFMTESRARSLRSRLWRGLVRRILSAQDLLTMGFTALRALKPLRWLTGLLPFGIPLAPEIKPGADELTEPSTTVVVLEGCVQQAATPSVNEALRTLLLSQGVAALSIQGEACCGALNYHLGEHDQGRQDMRRLLHQIRDQVPGDALVVSSASGCGVTVKDYAKYFSRSDPDYGLAIEISRRAIDAVELLRRYTWKVKPLRIAIHNPCTLTHGQGLDGAVGELLSGAGFELTIGAPATLACCGSAGTYSVLQPTLSKQLRDKMLSGLQRDTPDVIVTANIGCHLHLAAGSSIPVMHWIEILCHQWQLQNT